MREQFFFILNVLILFKWWQKETIIVVLWFNLCYVFVSVSDQLFIEEFVSFLFISVWPQYWKDKMNLFSASFLYKLYTQFRNTANCKYK